MDIVVTGTEFQHNVQNLSVYFLMNYHPLWVPEGHETGLNSVFFRCDLNTFANEPDGGPHIETIFIEGTKESISLGANVVLTPKLLDHALCDLFDNHWTEHDVASSPVILRHGGAK